MPFVSIWFFSVSIYHSNSSRNRLTLFSYVWSINFPFYRKPHVWYWKWWRYRRSTQLSKYQPHLLSSINSAKPSRRVRYYGISVYVRRDYYYYPWISVYMQPYHIATITYQLTENYKTKLQTSSSSWYCREF